MKLPIEIIKNEIAQRELANKINHLRKDEVNLELKSLNKVLNFLTTSDVEKRVFKCDLCGEEKTGRKFPVFDENFNKERGLCQCEECFKKGCGIE